MIYVEGLVKKFQDYLEAAVRTVDRVSFEVRAGEIYGILGPNGAGKITCLRNPSTVLKPTFGIAEVAERHRQTDMEELFFDVILKYEAETTLGIS